MTEDLVFAKETLFSGQLTCCIAKGNKIYKSEKRGVSPLISWYDSGENFTDFCAADKVVGKAAAFLYVLLKVKSIYAGVISTPSRELLEKNGIDVYYDKEVPAIINRAGDGLCPLESCVIDEIDAQAALEKIRKKLKELLGT